MSRLKNKLIHMHMCAYVCVLKLSTRYKYFNDGVEREKLLYGYDTKWFGTFETGTYENEMGANNICLKFPLLLVNVFVRAYNPLHMHVLIHTCNLKDTRVSLNLSIVER